ncbi:MAG: leucine-rich repeat domain-containing protein, partial [Clostridia bacterium]|nr:leucine-rich repeat domain-containing protein [Clostridia bacterium]
MNAKKTLVALLVFLFLFVSVVAIVGCNPQEEKPNEPTQIELAYNKYVEYAQQNNLTPLTSEEWIVSIKGEYGASGKSAYDVWLQNGNTGTVVDFLGWLKARNNTSYEWNIFAIDDASCDESAFYRIYADGNMVEWKQGTFDDHVADESGSCAICDFPLNPTKGLVYEVINGNYAKVVGYEGSSTGIKIADTYNDVPVTTIASGVFNNKIKKILISETITEIEEGAFDECTSLKYNEYEGGLYLGSYQNPFHALVGAKDTNQLNVNLATKIVADGALKSKSNLTLINLPDGLTHIGKSAFDNCQQLETISIPSTITYIGSEAFLNCQKLSYNKADNGLYLGNDQNDYVVMMGVDDKSITSFALNFDTKIINEWAFYGCYSLTRVDIATSVVQIGDYAFAENAELATAVLPKEIKRLGKGAFRNCCKLSAVNIPDGITVIGDETYYNCLLISEIV